MALSRKPVNYITGKVLKSWYEDLIATEKDGGCYSINFGDTDRWNYCICMGWTDGYEPNDEFDHTWRVAVGVKRQSHKSALQCDYDVDFDFP